MRRLTFFRWFRRKIWKSWKSFGDERTFTSRINRLLILNDVPFNFDDFSLALFHSRTLRTSARRWVKSTTTSRNDFRISRRTRKAGRIRFDTTWAWMNVSLRFRAKAAGNERGITGLWVSLGNYDFKYLWHKFLICFRSTIRRHVWERELQTSSTNEAAISHRVAFPEDFRWLIREFCTARCFPATSLSDLPAAIWHKVKLKLLLGPRDSNELSFSALGWRLRNLQHTTHALPGQATLTQHHFSSLCNQCRWSTTHIAVFQIALVVSLVFQENFTTDLWWISEIKFKFIIFTTYFNRYIMKT